MIIPVPLSSFYPRMNKAIYGRLGPFGARPNGPRPIAMTDLGSLGDLELSWILQYIVYILFVI